MKKIILISAVCLILGFAPHVLAQGFVPLAGIPGLTQGVDTTSGGLAVFFNNLYKYLIGLAAALAVIEIIWGGLEISTQDSVSKNKDGKDRIYQAIFGLVLILSPVLVFSIINPSILNLSLNLPKLDTASGSPAQTSSDASIPTTVGSGNPCGSINVGGSVNGDCTTTIFNEGPYTSPPPGAWCYQMKTPDNGKPYNCFRDSAGCTSVRRTSCGYAAQDVSCPATAQALNSCTQY